MPKRLYFIAIELPEPFKTEIQNLKLELSERYLSTHALKTPPHITLQMPMRIEEEDEGTLVSSLMKLDNIFSVGSVELNNISSFPHRTIFIDVVPNDFIRNLYNEVQSNLMSLDFIKDKVPLPSFHPHVTLMTRDLNKTNFRMAWEELKSVSYHEVIEVNAFQLYKHDGNFWQIRREFGMGNGE